MCPFLLLHYLIESAFGERLVRPKPPGAVPANAVCFELFVFWAVIAAAYALRRFSLLHEKERETVRLALEKARLEAGLREAEPPGHH